MCLQCPYVDLATRFVTHPNRVENGRLIEIGEIGEILGGLEHGWVAQWRQGLIVCFGKISQVGGECLVLREMRDGISSLLQYETRCAGYPDLPASSRWVARLGCP